MPKFKIEFCKVYLEPFEEQVVEAETELSAKIIARGLVTQRQREIETQITASVSLVKEEPSAPPTTNAGAGCPF